MGEEMVDNNKLCIICCTFVNEETQDEGGMFRRFCEEVCKSERREEKRGYDFDTEILELERRFGVKVCDKCLGEINELEISKEKMGLLETHVVNLQMEILRGLKGLEKFTEEIKCYRRNLREIVVGSDELSLKRRLKTEREDIDCFACKVRHWIMNGDRSNGNGRIAGQPVVKVETPANYFDEDCSDDDNTSNISWNARETSSSEIKREAEVKKPKSKESKRSSMTLRRRATKKANEQEILAPKNAPVITKRQSPKPKKEKIPAKRVVLKKKPTHFRTRRYCDLCPFNTLEEPSYEQHMLQHENEADSTLKILDCPECPSKFSTKQLFTFHQRCHQGLYKMCCDICSKMVPVLSLADHLKSHFLPEGEEPHVKIIYCQNCSFCCSSRQTYLVHLRRHCSKKIEGKFSCDICNEEFNQSIFLLNHFHDKHEGTLEKWRCDFPDCGKVYISKFSMKMHLMMHSKEKIFQCPNCDKKFKSKNHLQVHSLVHSDNKPNSCDLCDQSFRWKSGLIAHQRRDHGAAKLKCGYCEKEFCDANRLRGHIAKVHQGKGLPCEICGKTFGDKHRLRQHVESHVEENRFTCEQCGKGFKMEGGLKLHRKLHSGVKNWKCEYCEKAFARKQNLRDHLRVHTGERPFVCEICGKDFNQASALKTHKKNQHST